MPNRRLDAGQQTLQQALELEGISFMFVSVTPTSGVAALVDISKGEVIAKNKGVTPGRLALIMRAIAPNGSPLAYAVRLLRDGAVQPSVVKAQVSSITPSTNAT